MSSPARPQRDTTAVIIQPMFFPWRGQFDLMSRADIVIVLDTVQWVHNHWYNRNLVHGSNGVQWVTVPVLAKNHLAKSISEIGIDETKLTWRRRILDTLRQSYGKAPHFAAYFPEIERVINLPWTRIAALAQASTEFGLRALGRHVQLIRASDLVVDAPDPITRLVALCKAAGATRYISGPAAKAYIGESTAFADAGIALEWMSYAYPPYPQQREFRERELSILDLLFNCGPEASRFIWPKKGGP